MKKLILLLIFMCFAVNVYAEGRMIAPAPPGQGTYAELGEPNIFEDIQIAPAWQLTFPTVKGYPDTLTLRNISDVEVTFYVPDVIASNVTKTVVPNILTITADTTIEIFFDTVLINALSGAVTATVDAAPYIGQTHNMKSIDSTNVVTVNGGGKNIDGLATQTLVTDEAITIQYDGTEWRIL